MQLNKITVVEVMQKADNIPSDGTAADSKQKVEDISVSQHSSKPLVVGSQCHDTLNDEFRERAKKGYGHFVYEGDKLVGVAISFPNIVVEPDNKVC